MAKPLKDDLPLSYSMCVRCHGHATEAPDSNALWPVMLCDSCGLFEGECKCRV